ncbi:MAG: DUF1259 domain-containing protein [Acidobacteria bacterium]|nr:MAG: DUF1259 domain-containing protein [Acidobacteriota bacterium]
MKEPSPIQRRQSVKAVNWKAVARAMGVSGTMQPGGVFKFGLPRRDLRVTVEGVRLKPALALGSWIAFKQVDGETVVMGDLVLTEDEVSPVMQKLQQSGIEQMALHNHLLHESPRVMYMHIRGRGDPVKMARAIRAALALTGTPFTPSADRARPENPAMDTEQLDKIIGRGGAWKGGVYAFGIPRAEKITVDGMDVPSAMGVVTALNFQPVGDGRAAITGDFVLRAGEVNPVIRALRQNDIAVTALHSHMLTEEPRLFFMHFWAIGDAIKLARGLRAALDETNTVRGRAK